MPSHAARILDSLSAWLKPGPLGDKLRPSEYRLLISCGFSPALQHAGDIGTIHTSCAMFLRAIYHDSGVMPAVKRGKAGWPMWGGPDADGWLGTLGPRHPAAHKWSSALLSVVGPAWMLYVESVTSSTNNHVYMLVERIPQGDMVPYVTAGGKPAPKPAGPHTWKIAQGGGGDGTRCAYSYRELTDTSGRPIRWTFDPELIGVSPTADTEPPPRPELPTTPDPFPPPRTLRLTQPSRMKGYDVSCLQLALGVTADGTFGPLTHAAVQRYQRDHGLTPDGVVGPKTRAALGLSV